MRVSLIVPMYNVEAYLEECLDSLRKQTLLDMEILLIDDGSTDRTKQIAERYVLLDSRFAYYRKENGGLSDARNFGIPLAKGDYIAFLDSDDRVAPSLYEKMAEAIGDADVLVSDIRYWFENPEQDFIMKGLSDWTAETIQKQALLSPMFAWNKLYRSAWFKEKGLRYPKGLWYEDLPVTTRIFAQSEKIAYLPECLFDYRQRQGSIMASTSDPRLAQIFDILAMVRNNFLEDGLYDTYREELEYLHIEHLRLYGMFRFIRSDNARAYYAKSEEVMKEFFPDWKKNRYLSSLSFKNRMFLRWYSPVTAWIFDPLIRK
jgi:glycosyltransferase involved in cell wall biosynthesis